MSFHTNAPAGSSAGTGSLTVSMSEDAYAGDAQFIAIVDGQQVGGVQTVTAAHATGALETFDLGGSFASGAHMIAIKFLNDAYGGSSALDRNLYVHAVSLGGATATLDQALYKTGDIAALSLGAAASTPAGTGLVLALSEDAYLGDARFYVRVDGVQFGGVHIVSAAHAAGAVETFYLGGQFSYGPHSVAVSFLNNAYGGSPARDRNLYVRSIGLNGRTATLDQALWNTGDTATAAIGAVAPPSPHPQTGLSLLGVNLSGAEYNPASLPGAEYTDYVLPSHGEIDYYAGKGFDIIRLPFLWERLQPTQGGALNQTYLAQIDDVVAYATSKGLDVDLDLHNYGYGYGNLVGSAGTPDSSFANVWAQLAAHYVGNSRVLFGLMNEPHDQGAAQWAQSANAAIQAIRAAGATSQEILVSGTAWDTAATWISSGNATILGSMVTDPSHRMAFEVHQYLDADSSGTSTQVVSPTIGAQRLADVTQWAKATGNQLFLGEFGSGADPASLAALHNMLAYMEQHNDVWQGGTDWAGGPWWGGYGFSVEPANGVDKPQIGVLTGYVSHPV